MRVVTMFSFMIVPFPPSLRVEVIKLAWRVIAKNKRKRVCLDWRSGAGANVRVVVVVYLEYTQSTLRVCSESILVHSKTCSE